MKINKLYKIVFVLFVTFFINNAFSKVKPKQILDCFNVTKVIGGGFVTVSCESCTSIRVDNIQTGQSTCSK